MYNFASTGPIRQSRVVIVAEVVSDEEPIPRRTTERSSGAVRMTATARAAQFAPSNMTQRTRPI